jgi:hypothetical protein
MSNERRRRFDVSIGQPLRSEGLRIEGGRQPYANDSAVFAPQASADAVTSSRPKLRYELLGMSFIKLITCKRT